MTPSIANPASAAARTGPGDVCFGSEQFRNSAPVKKDQAQFSRSIPLCENGRPSLDPGQPLTGHQDNSTRLRAALWWAARGFQVFPVKPRSKVPLGFLVPNGFKNASRDPAVIKNWWARCPDANIGIRTGIDGLFVLDLDGPDAIRWFINFCGRHGVPEKTLEQSTSRGRHLFYRTGIHLPCSSGFLAPGVDIKATGGCITVAPSVHPDGTVYRIIHNFSVAPAPAWLVDLALPPPPPPVPSSLCNYTSNDPPIDVRSLVRRAGGGMVLAGGHKVLIRGPGHSSRDRSLMVDEAPGRPGGFSFYSFASDDYGTCADFIRELAGLPRWQPGKPRSGGRP